MGVGEALSFLGADRWRELTRALEGGGWIGLMDQVMFYLAITMNSYGIAAGWLAFKVASKW